MKTIRIHCGACDTWFDFQHPAITSVARMQNLNIACSACREMLTVPSDELHMVPLKGRLNKQLTDASLDAKVIDIRSHEDSVLIDLEYNTTPKSEIVKIMGRVVAATPSMMPPHPPPAPTPKAMAHTKGKPRSDRPLTQKPFQGLDDLLK